MAQAPLRVALEMREHSETRVDRRASKHATRDGVGQGVEAKRSKQVGPGLRQAGGWSITPLCPCTDGYS